MLKYLLADAILSSIYILKGILQAIEDPTPEKVKMTVVFFQDSTCGIRLLGEWSEIFPYDFRDERMMEQVRRLTEMCTKQRSHQSHRKDMSLILHNLLHRLSALEKYEEHLQDLNARLSPRILHQPTKVFFTSHDGYSLRRIFLMNAKNNWCDFLAGRHIKHL